MKGIKNTPFKKNLSIFSTIQFYYFLMVFVYIIFTSKLQQGNKVIFQKLHTCTKIKNKTKGKKTIQKRTINTSPSKKAEKNQLNKMAFAF